jgi:hypothetical protein
MHANCLKGVSLVSVRGENSSGQKQLQQSFGELDESRWKEHVERLFPNPEVLKSHSVRNHPALTPEQAEEYGRLVNPGS